MVKTDKEIIIFDLDGTLAESKQPITKEMADLIKELTKHYLVAVISGGFFEQYQKQFLGNLTANEEVLKKIILLPTSGTTLYRYENDNWEKIYSEDIEDIERERIIKYLEEAIEHFNLKPEKSFGDLIEDRKTQITYSGLGQLASPELKKVWDPNKEKRSKVVEYLKNKISEYSIGIGGMTSIDITKPGIDKAYGIKKIEEVFNIPIQKMIFVGDALEDGGNDAPAKKTGVDCIAVNDISETKEYIESII